MRNRHLACLGALLAAAWLSSPRTLAQTSSGSDRMPAWSPPRTPWGAPDLQGVYTTDGELGVPFERPEEFGTRAVVSDEEFARRQAQWQRQIAADGEPFVVERPATTSGPIAGGTGPPSHWLERGQPSRRTSLVVDPPDGQVPYRDEEARQRGRRAAARAPVSTAYRGPEDLDLYDRCITRGLPHVIFPTIYNNTSQIVQGPGYVAIRYEMIHDVRVIPLDGRPHLRPEIRQWFGDSRGRWEGDTLVVDVTNFSGRVSYRGSTTGLHLTERFTPVAPDTVRYEVTVEDGTTFARPWTAALDLKRDPRQVQVFEYACHEGNHAMTNILSGARAAESN
jgi:hypothetical protein